MRQLLMSPVDLVIVSFNVWNYFESNRLFCSSGGIINELCFLVRYVSLRIVTITIGG